MPADNLPPDKLADGLREFVRFRNEHLIGDEKGEAQVFLDRLFRALGHDGVFEAGARLEQRFKRNDTRGTSFADLFWAPRVLIEMKKAGEPLGKHYQQAFDYWLHAVPNRPKYVVLCNFDELWIYDLNVQLDDPVDQISVADLPNRPAPIAFMLPHEERPTFQNDLVQLTRETAATVAGVFHRMKDRGVHPDVAQRFVLQSVMAMFAEDINLLPMPYFKQAIEDSLSGGSAYDLVFGLFQEMNREGLTPHGRYQGTRYFNGGLYSEISPVALQKDELELLLEATQADWAGVRPAIFGTLFEQSMGLDERHAYGAHFTSETDIQKVVRPCIVEPWMERINAAGTIAELEQIADGMQQYRVLDASCGCGNFLYVAYQELRRLEKLVAERVSERRQSEGLAAALRISFVSTTQFFGIDIRDFAVEVAKVTMMLGRKVAADRHNDERNALPLDDLNKNIVCSDALFAQWPQHDVVIGNPPYLGRQKLTAERGAGYVARLDEAFPEVHGFSDYVSFFVQRTHDHMKDGQYAGLVATNTVRQNETRNATTEYIIRHGGTIVDAVSSQPWSGDAAVHVSIINWVKGDFAGPKTLWLQDGETKLTLERISGALSAEVDLIDAKDLSVNQDPKRFFQGQTPGSKHFVLTSDQATHLVGDDPSSVQVLHPYLIGREIGKQGQPQRYIMDIDASDVGKAKRWKAAFAHAQKHVLPLRKQKAADEELKNAERRQANSTASLRTHHRGFLARWWQLSYRREDMLKELSSLDRYVAMSRVGIESRPPVFVFVDAAIRPSDALQVFAFDDDYSLGVLQSRYHELWFRERCSSMKIDLRYTSETVFDSFPWPQAPTEEQGVAVADATKAILQYRDELASDDGLTLNEMYATFAEQGANKLRELHAALDDAVRAAYGFSEDDGVLEQLLALNLSIAEALEEGGPVRGPGNTGLAGTKVTSARIVSGLPVLG